MQNSFEAHTVPFYRGTVEAAFAINPVTTSGNYAESSMSIDGSSFQQDGSFIYSGAAGPLIDDVSAYAVLTARSADQWAVTSEISVDFHSRIPANIGQLNCQATAVSVNKESGYSTGELRSPNGFLFATLGQRMRFIPGDESFHHGPWSTEDSYTWPHELDEWLQLHPLALPPDNGSVFQFHAHSKMANPLKTLHGGIGLTVTEIAAYKAWENSKEYSGSLYSTTSIRMSYLRPGLIEGGFSIAVNIIHASRSIVTLKVRTYGSDGKLVTFGIVTLHKISSATKTEF